jgi:hypothetical protein
MILITLSPCEVSPAQTDLIWIYEKVLGRAKKSLSTGFSAAEADLHFGLLAETDIVRGCPKELRYRAIRLIAGKTALAARVDTHRGDREGRQGQAMRELIEKKVEKWQEPPPTKVKKALPVPLPPPRKKRGGKRFRKMREKYQITDVQKAKNRMTFGAPELTDEYTGEGFGQLVHLSSILRPFRTCYNFTFFSYRVRRRRDTSPFARKTHRNWARVCRRRRSRGYGASKQPVTASRDRPRQSPSHPCRAWSL